MLRSIDAYQVRIVHSGGVWSASKSSLTDSYYMKWL